MTDGPAIRASRLTQAYGPLRALDGLDLSVERGRLFALLGPNGAGKSTAVSIFTTLRTPTSGTAEVAGHDVVRAAREVRRRAGVVFQDSSLDDRLTARENLMLHAAIFGVPRGERRRRVEARLRWMDLTSSGDRIVRMLSGGMKRRLEIARALVHEPEVLFLDEPTVGLDPQTRRAMWGHLLELSRAGDSTVFVTTHYMDEAEGCDAVAILDHGKLVAQGTPAELLTHAGPERLVLGTVDDARARAEASALGLTAEVTAEGVVVQGDGAETMLSKLSTRGLAITKVAVIRPRLEDAFVALTGRRIRDAADEGEGDRAAMQTNLRARGRR